MKHPAAVLGVGQTRHRSKRTDVTIAGLCREAADRALLDAGLEFADIDAVVVGKAPDLFEGVMMPELYLADALGAVGKPLLRVHTAGSVGGATGIVATSLVQAGLHRRVMAVAFEKQSESNAMWALSIAPPFSIPVVAGAGGYFAPHIRAYIRRSGAPGHIGAMVAVKDRRNGALNPYAHLQQPDITLESVQASPMLWDPVRYDETCPSSDGACAVVIGDSDAAVSSAAAGRPVAWIRATSMRTEPTMFAGKDPVNPAAGVAAADAVTAASATFADMIQFCNRQPDACAAGAQFASAFGQRAQAGAKLLYEIVGEKFAKADNGADAAAAPTGTVKLSQNTLTPSDLAPAWRSPHRKDKGSL